MAVFYSEDAAGSFAHNCLPAHLQEKYSIMQVHHIIEALNEYLDYEDGDPNDYEAMLEYIINGFGALDGQDKELTIDDLKAICVAEGKYVDSLEDDGEDD